MPGSETHAQPAQFEPTRWSVVVAARDAGNSARAHEALGKLCATYWYPLYAFVRRSGSTPHDAQDLTQEFFARLIEKRWLDGVAPQKGRFRSFLLAAMKHFLTNEWHRAQRLKRGGGIAFLPLDTVSAEARYAGEPIDTMDAEKIFDRRWALTLLEQVMDRLQGEFSAAGKGRAFELMKAALVGEKPDYARLAESLKMSDSAVRVAVHRLRQRYHELVRAEIAETVSTKAEIDGEVQSLFAALAG
jgi:RNA polymerase sigma-70 factor (ECF subfamily)